MRKNILLFLSASPLPIDDGIKKINNNLIRTFLEQGHKVTLVLPEGSGKPYAETFYFYYQKKRTLVSLIGALISGKPLYFPLYFDRRFKVDYSLFDVIFYDFYPMTQYSKGQKNELFMMPDSMVALAWSQVKNTPSFLRKIYHLLNFLLAKNYNRRIKKLKKLYVSKEDIRLDDLKNSYFFKIPADEVDLGRYQSTVFDTKEIMFRGVMSFEPNITAVKNFYHEIFLELIKKYPDFRLKVLGKDPSRELQAEMPVKTRFTGFVDDIFQEMAESGIHIVPMLSGSGVKTKLLDSMALKRLVFATPKAIHGVFEDVQEAKENGVLIYTDKEEFFYYFDMVVNHQIDYQQMTEKAYKYIRKNSYKEKIEELMQLAQV